MDFLRDMLAEYGTALEQHRGQATVRGAAEAAACEFCVGHFPDGRVLMAVQGGSDLFGVCMAGPESITGRLSSGEQCRSVGPFHEVSPLRSPGGEVVEGAWAVFDLSGFEIDGTDPAVVVRRRYLITNFVFDTGSLKPWTLTLSGGPDGIELAPLQGVIGATDRLRTLATPRPTAVLTIPATAGGRDEAQEVAENVCYLLSIARGTKIQWIKEDEVAEGDRVVRRHLWHRVTKRYAPFAPIDPYRIKGTADFVETCYPTYLANRDRLRLNRGTIDSVLDAKGEGDFLETRAAKLAVALETLKENVLEAESPESVYLLPSDQFDALLEPIGKAIKASLEVHGVEPAVRDLLASPRKLSQLNRRPFSNLIGRVARKIQLKIPQEEIRLFVACRNSLIHRGKFYCVTATEEERALLPPKESKLQEYLFMIAVLDAFLLRLVGYGGTYLVRTDGAEWEARQL